MALSRKRKYMAGLIVAYVILYILLTPLGGLETRDVSKVTGLGLATLGLLFIGLALNVACLVLILRRYERAPLFGVLGSIFYFPALVADRLSIFSSLQSPVGITYVEVVEAFVAIGIMSLGLRILREKTGMP